jgi:hypothetical protein
MSELIAECDGMLNYYNEDHTWLVHAIKLSLVGN